MAILSHRGRQRDSAGSATACTELPSVPPVVLFVGIALCEHFGEEGLACFYGDGVGVGGEVVADDAEEG